jgi:histidyl-tRNA synthetase
MRLLDCKDPKCAPIKENAPDSVSYLCAPCKHHFKEVLEYLEQMNISYRINKNLVRGLSYYTRTVFEIIEQGLGEGAQPLTIAAGGRYDYLAKQIGNKKDVPAVGAGIGADRVIMSPWFSKLTPRIVKKPKIYFIQLGMEAKLKSLNVIEILRKAKISIAQSLSKDSLGAQLAVAEKLNVPYTLIFGQKEALEDSVIVRDMATRSQETVKIKNLPDYIKKLK